MDSRLFANFLVLLMLSPQLFFLAKGDGDRSVVFFDNPNHRFLRGRSTELGNETGEMSMDDVSAAASVLLGFAPSASLHKASNSKLNELLLPNPFNRPRTVLMVEVRGVEGAVLGDLSYKIGSSNKNQIAIPVNENELAVIPIDESLDCVTCLDDEFANLAQLLGGTYVGTMKAMDGMLSFPLPSGKSFVLHVSEQSELDYATRLASLVRGIKKAAQTHEDLSGSFHGPAELLMGTFTGIEALNIYGTDVAEQGIELFHMALTKMFDLLEKYYNGKIVGIVVFSKEESLRSQSIFDMTSVTNNLRLLEEVKNSNSSDSGLLFVRKSLAWITGLILVVATLIGTYLLVTMPLTRDTLLYANVKLD